ncbi:MAG TPA: hypothetical protein ENO08_00035 [Candidatus Eisenbacteria bacterium]|uniref:Uncharacterized protein n=1 Tax=Eiseniibacteriota bacterium TaxID=2212470 RepID=A0A7V2AT90_UNCEI|nr:hypothetical protein [Candidatus Eisenbacteria bacterium]
MVQEKGATLEEILATFSSHVSKNYPSPEEFQERLRLLLDNKRAGKEGGAYAQSLETNVVFLHDLVTEGRVLLDLLLRPDKAPKKNLEAIIEEMEGKVRAQTKKRHAAVFDRGEDEEFRELAEMRRGKAADYIERLEFNYLYLMTLRMLLFEFMSVLQSIKAEYRLADMKPGVAKEATDSLALTAHFYLGNVKVAEELGGGSDEEPGAPGSSNGGHNA